MTDLLRQVNDLVELSVVVDPTFDQNCYVLHRRDTSAALVVDPGLQHAAVVEFLERRHLVCSRILATHGHPDHVNGVPALRTAFACSAAIHPDDRPLLDAVTRLPGVPADLPPVIFDEDLLDGQRITWQDLAIDVLHTPGHTRGSVCFAIRGDGDDQPLLSGDTLFRRGIGRTDLPGGSTPAILFSIEHIVYALPPDTIVYPGHGPSTTIGEEQRENPFVVHPRYR